MLIVLGVLVELLGFGFGDVARKDAHDRAALGVHRQHDLGRLFAVHAEKDLQHMDHELHRRVVVIEQNDLVHGRLFQLRLGFGDRHSAVFAKARVIAVLRAPMSAHPAMKMRLGCCNPKVRAFGCATVRTGVMPHGAIIPAGTYPAKFQNLSIMES